MKEVEVLGHLKMLGLKVKDRVTGFAGVVTSVGFDLYGCIQCVVTPGMNTKEEKLRDSLWFDINRLEVMSPKPVMQCPNFEFGPVAKGEKGAAPKPIPGGAPC